MHRLVYFVVGKFVSKRIPSSSFCSLLHGFGSCMAWSAFLYLCLLFSKCNVYAEIGLFVLMYLVCL